MCESRVRTGRREVLRRQAHHLRYNRRNAIFYIVKYNGTVQQLMFGGTPISFTGDKYQASTVSALCASAGFAPCKTIRPVQTILMLSHM